MARVVDAGAVLAGWVGVGMAVVIAVTFVLLFPVEPIYWAFAPLAGILVGYYANARAERNRGEWRRIGFNAAWAGIVTGIAFALLLVGFKAIFFFADAGYRDPSLGGSLTCGTGADCVYRRYLDEPQTARRLVEVGVVDVASFQAFYWSQQASTAASLVAATLAGAGAGAALYGASRPRGPRRLPAGDPATGPGPGRP